MMPSRWNQLIDKLPSLHECLANAAPLPNPTYSEFKGKAGVYAFKERNQIIHVGRTRNLQGRIRGHRTANPNSASLAFKMARKKTGREEATYKTEGSRSDLLTDDDFKEAWIEAISRIKIMEVVFIELECHETQYLLELYSCMAFGLPTDEFRTT